MGEIVPHGTFQEWTEKTIPKSLFLGTLARPYGDDLEIK